MEAQKYRHEHWRPCPISGKPIPREEIFTDRKRPGVFNSCAACNQDNRTLGERLHDLNEKRKR